MNKYRFYLDNELIDEFDSLDDAEWAVEESREGIWAGRDVLELAGEPFIEPSEVTYRIDEVDENGNVIDSNEY